MIWFYNLLIHRNPIRTSELFWSDTYNCKAKCFLMLILSQFVISFGLKPHNAGYHFCHGTRPVNAGYQLGYGVRPDYAGCHLSYGARPDNAGHQSDLVQGQIVFYTI